MEPKYKTGREFLQAWAEFPLMDGDDPETDGMAFHARIWVEVARDMLAGPEPLDDVQVTTRRYVDECDRRWRAGKFFQLHQTEGPAGFERRGWEM